MPQGNFLVRNRHNSNWYGRVSIPYSLRPYFNHRAELRISLGTPDKKRAKRLSRFFWIQCQQGFDRLEGLSCDQYNFERTEEYLAWLYGGEGDKKMGWRDIEKFLEGKHEKRLMEFTDATGSRHVIDFGDPEKERLTALEIQQHAIELLDRFKDNPDVLDRILRAKGTELSKPENQPETETSFVEAIDRYINKLKTRGNKGRKLAPRTLTTYEDKLRFWQGYFYQRPVHSLTLQELGEIQNWLVNLPANFSKKNLSTTQAVERAKANDDSLPPISDKTRAEYLGQLRGLLQYCFRNGYIAADMTGHIEMPNTKRSKSIDRLPFSGYDLQKIFPGSDYGVDFGIQKAGLAHDAKFWFPLLGLFTGARVEELGQLQAEDIKTDPETGIIYMMIDDKGVTADGVRKRTKTESSVRPIPIHSTLLEIGFMEFVAERSQDKSDTSLFKLKRGKQGRLTKSVSNWFSRLDKRKDGNTIKGYIERRGIESKGTTAAGQRWSKSFHSFRHTVIDNLRGKQMATGEFIREPDIALIVGHEKGKLETADYGKDRMQLALRQAVIESINYSGVGFENIRWSKNAL